MLGTEERVVSENRQGPCSYEIYWLEEESEITPTIALMAMKLQMKP